MVHQPWARPRWNSHRSSNVPDERQSAAEVAAMDVAVLVPADDVRAPVDSDRIHRLRLPLVVPEELADNSDLWIWATGLNVAHVQDHEPVRSERGIVRRSAEVARLRGVQTCAVVVGADVVGPTITGSERRLPNSSILKSRTPAPFSGRGRRSISPKQDSLRRSVDSLSAPPSRRKCKSSRRAYLATVFTARARESGRRRRARPVWR